MVSMIDMVKILCGVGGFILIIFLIIMVSNAISTLKRLNAVLDDSKIVFILGVQFPRAESNEATFITPLAQDAKIGGKLF